MEALKKIITLFALMVTISVTFASFISVETQTITEVENCESRSEVISNCVKCQKCSEFKPKEYAKPQSITPTTILTPVDVESVQEEKVAMKEVQVISNVKFGDIYCDDCSEKVEYKEYSEPGTVKKETVFNQIKSFVVDCFFY